MSRCEQTGAPLWQLRWGSQHTVLPNRRVPSTERGPHCDPIAATGCWATRRRPWSALGPRRHDGAGVQHQDVEAAGHAPQGRERRHRGMVGPWRAITALVRCTRSRLNAHGSARRGGLANRAGRPGNEQDLCRRPPQLLLLAGRVCRPLLQRDVAGRRPPRLLCPLCMYQPCPRGSYGAARRRSREDARAT